MASPYVPYDGPAVTKAEAKAAGRRPVVLPPIPDHVARGPSAQYLRHLRRSMQAWDRLPEEFRQFCSEYPRTADAVQLAEVLELCDGDVDEAKAMLRELMPARPL